MHDAVLRWGGGLEGSEPGLTTISPTQQKSWSSCWFWNVGPFFELSSGKRAICVMYETSFFFLHSLQPDHHLLAGCCDRNSAAVHWCVVIASFERANIWDPQQTLLLSCCSAAKFIVVNNFSWKTKWVLQQSEHNKWNRDSERPANGNSLLHLKGWY